MVSPVTDATSPAGPPPGGPAAAWNPMDRVITVTEPAGDARAREGAPGIPQVSPVTDATSPAGAPPGGPGAAPGMNQ